ncbi:MAG: chromate transporter [Solobacterium sp.]|nr:chromate transporter [Erysipelotrichaceae bacterium]MBQ9153244.1 chromate transporter [Solobacterium sp.]
MNRNRKTDIGTFLTLFKETFIISATTFGGGAVIISMLQKTFVERLKWIDEDEMMDLIAIAQSCPGVMAVNSSIIIGYRIAGVPGALLTVLGTVTPPMIILTIISMFYVQFRSNRIVALVLKGMQAGVIAVLMSVSISMTSNVLKEKSILNYILLALACIAVIGFGVDVILAILGCGIIGGIYTWIQMKGVRS